MSNEANSFLMQSGAKAYKFDNVGDTAKGTIESLEMMQQKDVDTEQPVFWPDGKPKMMLRVVLATDLSEDGEDDGKRSVYVRGQMQTVVRDAVKASGAGSIEVGGTLAVQFTALGEKKKAAWNAPKVYKASYKAPVATPVSVGVDDLL
jgi:hypothetical protein